MPVSLAPSFSQVAAACFPLPGCSVSGYAFAQGTRYNLTIYTPAGAGCPSHTTTPPAAAATRPWPPPCSFSTPAPTPTPAPWPTLPNSRLFNP